LLTRDADGCTSADVTAHEGEPELSELSELFDDAAVVADFPEADLLPDDEGEPEHAAKLIATMNVTITAVVLIEISLALDDSADYLTCNTSGASLRGGCLSEVESSPQTMIR
jgi:hypothetical protein